MQLNNRVANRTWMLDIIMTLTGGNHEYFSKNFRPNVVQFQAAAYEVNNNDNFYTGLANSVESS